MQGKSTKLTLQNTNRTTYGNSSHHAETGSVRRELHPDRIQEEKRRLRRGRRHSVLLRNGQSLVRRSRPSGRHGTGRIFRQRGRNSRTDERHGNRQRRRVDGRVPPGRRDGCAGRDTRARSGGSTCSGSGSSACGSCRDDRRSGIRSDRRFVARFAPRQDARGQGSRQRIGFGRIGSSRPRDRAGREGRAGSRAENDPAGQSYHEGNGCSAARGRKRSWPAWPRVPM